MPALNFQSLTAQVFLIVIITAWSLVWKGLALYRAARNEHKIWFIFLLGINTFGVLEILYYFWIYKFDFSRIKLWLKK